MLHIVYFTYLRELTGNNSLAMQIWTDSVISGGGSLDIGYANDLIDDNPQYFHIES